MAWTEFLEESWRLVKDDPAGRRAMARGQVPNHCEDCAGGKWRQRMEAQGRCQPLPVAIPITDLPPSEATSPLMTETQMALKF